MKCPNCRLENPESALRCDCGFDFGTGQIKSSYLTNDQRMRMAAQESLDPVTDAVRRRFVTKLWIALGVGVVLVPVIEPARRGVLLGVLFVGALLLAALILAGRRRR